MENEMGKKIVRLIVERSGRQCKVNLPCCLHLFLEKLLYIFEVENNQLSEEEITQKPNDINGNQFYHSYSLFYFLEKYISIIIVLDQIEI